MNEQFKKHMKELFLFDFGKSDTTGEPIWKTIKRGAPASFAVGFVHLFCIARLPVCRSRFMSRIIAALILIIGQPFWPCC